jgi:hypothetical protein
LPKLIYVGKRHNFFGRYYTFGFNFGRQTCQTSDS